MLGDISREIARILATKVRVLTAEQIAMHFFPRMANPLQCAHRAIRKLRACEFGTSWQTSVTHLKITSTIFRWDPNGVGSYSPAQIAWRNSKRWQAAPLKRTVCITSTNKSRAYFGGRCRTPRSRELEHDINVAGLYLILLRKSPLEAATWKHEDHFDGHGSIRPDATLIDIDGQTVVIDLLGRGYSAEKIAGIIRRHAGNQLRLY